MDKCLFPYRFGRVVDQRWIKSDDVSNPLDRFQYGYDRNGNRMYRENLIEDDFDELYHANGESAGYDLLNQLTEFSRGELSDSGTDDVPDTVSSPDRNQTWDLDAMGNWESITTDSVEEERVHNKQNQVTDVEANELDFDDNGNTTTDEQGNTLVYDAWNRLVSFDDGTDTVTYAYDAIGRRTERTQDSVTTDFYYSDKWQVLEERVSGNAHAQYVWSPVYVDAMIVRDRDADSSSGNGLEERLYVLQDANWNVTAIANAAGTVQERYVYDPYGTPTRLTAGWGTPSGDTYNWVYLHQGGRYEAATGLYNFRMRDFSPTLGRWMQNDPLGYVAGDFDLYRYVKDNPSAFTDPYGLKGGHHWFPQAFKPAIDALCPDLGINYFTTPTVTVNGTRYHIGLPNEKGTIHNYLTYGFKYNKEFEKILGKAKTCCDLLMDVNDLLHRAAEYLSNEFFHGAPVKLNIQSYFSKVDNGKSLVDEIDKCYTKCPERRRPVPVTVPETVPDSIPAPVKPPDYYPIPIPGTPAPKPVLRPAFPSFPFLLVPLYLLGINPETGKPYGPGESPMA